MATTTIMRPWRRRLKPARDVARSVNHLNSLPGRAKEDAPMTRFRTPARNLVAVAHDGARECVVELCAPSASDELVGNVLHTAHNSSFNSKQHSSSMLSATLAGTMPRGSI